MTSIGPLVPRAVNPRSRFLQILEQRFGESDLKRLCFDLEVEYDDLGGEDATKSVKAIELIKYFERHSRLPDLEQYIRQSRPDVPWDEQPSAPLQVPVFQLAHIIHAMPGESEPHRKLAALVTKYGNISRLLEAEPLGSTDLLERVQYYSTLEPDRRDPAQLLQLPEIKEQLAEILQSLPPFEVLRMSFASWRDLYQAVEQTGELSEKCGRRIRMVNGFAQSLTVVCQGLGLEEPTIYGVEAALANVRIVTQELRDRTRRPEDALPAFNTLRRIIESLLAFYLRTLQNCQDNWRATLCNYLGNVTGEADHPALKSLRRSNTSLADVVQILTWVDELLWAQHPQWLEYLKREFWNVPRDALIEHADWNERLAGIAAAENIIRCDMQEGVDQRANAIKALDCTKEFYTYLGSSGIYPQIQHHETIEITRFGEAVLSYFDELGEPRTLSLDGQRDFSRDFYPGELVFFKYLADGKTPYWLPVRERSTGR